MILIALHFEHPDFKYECRYSSRIYAPLNDFNRHFILNIQIFSTNVDIVQAYTIPVTK